MKNNSFNIETSDLFDTVKHLQSEGCVFQYFDNESFNGRTIHVNGKDLIHFASCSYLGLETHPNLIEGSINAVKKYGTQTPSSRAMVSSPLYKEAEDLCKQIFPGYQTITQTVTLAHCGVLPLLVNENDALILDGYAHNSIRMASEICKSNGTFVIYSKHNDIEHVKYLIYRLKKEGKKNIWYCADGIYSIHGNFCNVKDLYTLLDEEDNFYAYIDDAHGTGWTGKNGCGYVIGNYGLHDKSIIIQSFAKSLVSSGGLVIVPDKLISDYISLTGQTLIFSGPLQPALLGSLIAALKLHLSNDIIQYQNELLHLIEYFRKKSTEYELPIVTKNNSPIELLRIGDMNKTYQLLLKLIDAGYFSMTAGYPAISKGDEGIRITITRHLTTKDIDGFLKRIKSNL
jgi:7-keto-8-aminopelargonate synthetase-like enzyme